MKEIGFSILRSLTFIIPQLIILSACIYYLIKKTTLDGILLILGSLVGLAVTIFRIIVLPYLYQKNIVDPITGGINLMTFIGAISFIGSLAFSTGLFILIYNSVRTRKMNQQKDTIDYNLSK